jgi:beta-lactamase superfamily II metal-dependent hydrolase
MAVLLQLKNKMCGMKKTFFSFLILLWLTLTSSLTWAFTPSGLLEIHYINVGWGTSVLVIGPDGTRMLMDGGRQGMGTAQVVPYMQSIGLMAADSLTYILSSHLHSDHIAGLTEVMNSGYYVSNAVYYNGSDYSNSYVTAFRAAAINHSPGPINAIALGTVIPLGESATATIVCSNGYVIGHGYVPGSHDDENDRSIGVLIKYGRFEYLFAGDLGGGEGDNACTHRTTSQVNVETNLAQAIMPGGEHPLLSADGVEVLHVNHHGSESSTNSDYVNLLTPKIACIATGSGQSADYMFPRFDVVNVLLSNVYCVTADPAIVLQNEEGYPAGSLTSYAGYCVGDIKIVTSGVANYTVSANGQVTEGPDERAAIGLPLTIPFDGVSPDIVPPTVTVISPDGGEQWTAGSWHIITWNAFDSVGVASYAIDYSTDSGGNWTSIQVRTDGNLSSYAWSLPLTASPTYLVKVSVWDASNNTAVDNSNGFFSIITSQDSIAPFVTLNTPNGGEVWYSNDIDTIRWQATDNVGVASYSLSYTSNNGTSWNTIRSRAEGNPQIYPWSIPNIQANNSKVRVIVWDDVQHPDTDFSDANFNITYRDNQGPTVDIIIPDGGEIWSVGSTRYIFWTATDTSGVDSVSLQYSVDTGANWRVIFPFTHTNPGFYSWTVPDTPSRQTLIRAACMDGHGNVGYGSSHAVFTIRKSPVYSRYARVMPMAR